VRIGANTEMKKSNRQEPLRVRPAASSRAAAEFLQSSNGSSAFGNASGFGSVSSTFTVNEPITSTSTSSGSIHTLPFTSRLQPPPIDDGDFNLVFRKLSKRDPITKLKALEEMRALIENRTAEELKILLPALVQCYERLAMDNDRHVREMLYSCLHPLISKVGKPITPFLRRIIPHWWLHAYDPSSLVCKAAMNALQLSFPGTKQVDVLYFAHSSYFELLQLVYQSTPTTLSDMTLCTTTEAEERFERVMQAAILSLSGFIDLMPEDMNLKLTSDFVDLIDKVKPFVQSSHPNFRRSTYILYTSILKKLSWCVRDNLSSLAPSLFNALDEKERTNHPTMWEMLLLLVRTFPEAWQLVASSVSPNRKSSSKQETRNADVTPSVWSKLWHILDHDGYGSPQLLYHYLLPLVSTITAEVASMCNSADPASLYIELLNHVINKNKFDNLPHEITPANHPAEIAALTGYIECSVYLINTLRYSSFFDHFYTFMFQMDIYLGNASKI
jgi:hypothetical protein